MCLRIVRYIWSTTSFYPLFPAPQDMAHEVNLDISHSSGLSLDSEDRYAPEVLIAPSRLKQFTKVGSKSWRVSLNLQKTALQMVETTLTVNPSFATKGTCARFKVAATTTDSRGQISCEILWADFLFLFIFQYIHIALLTMSNGTVSPPTVCKDTNTLKDTRHKVWNTHPHGETVLWRWQIWSG